MSICVDLSLVIEKKKRSKYTEMRDEQTVRLVRMREIEILI